MKTLYLSLQQKVIVLILGCWVVFTSNKVVAQTDLVQILNTSQSDFNKLMDGYYKPVSKAAGTAMNHGWHNVAEPMRIGRFDVRLLASAAFAPTKDQTLDLNTLGLSNAFIFNPDSSITAGLLSSNKGQTVQYFPEGVDPTIGTPASLALPDGVGFNAVPIPAIQVNVGLLWGTELSMRFAPPVSFDNNQDISEENEGKTKIGMWGIGLKHDFQQWIPGFNLWPVKFSLALGFSHASIKANTALTPGDTTLVLQGANAKPDYSKFTNQQLNFTVDAFHAGLMFSRKFPIVTFYGGLWLEASSSKFEILGNYPIAVQDNDPNSLTFGNTVIAEINDPYSITHDFGQASFNLGVRFKLGVFSLFVDYSAGTQGYQNLSTGIGFGLYEN